MYLWRQECEAQGKVPFWELLRLLHKHQDVFFSSPVEIENVGCCLFLFVHNFYVFFGLLGRCPCSSENGGLYFLRWTFQGREGCENTQEDLF